MIRDSKKLEEFERWYARRYVAPQTYAEALSIFVSLWNEARALRPDFPTDWREDVKSCVELARVLNGLPVPVATDDEGQ